MQIFKQILLLPALYLAAMMACHASDDMTEKPAEQQIILAGTGMRPRLAEPTATYQPGTRLLTIQFSSAFFEPYTLTVSSPYNSLDYYVTTPFTSVNISPDVVEVDLLLETTSGDMYYGSFEATEAGSTE